MNNKEIKGEEKDLKNTTKKKPFIKPELEVYEPLVDITLFTSTGNVGGGTFF